MIIYLRDKITNEDYFDVEFYETTEENKFKYIELHGSVYAHNSFIYLLKRQNDKEYIKKFIDIFEFLEEIRGWYYEMYLNENPNPTYSEVLEELRKIMHEAAVELDFIAVED